MEGFNLLGKKNKEDWHNGDIAMMIDWLKPLVAILDKHQGSCLVLLTVALVACAIVSCLIALKSVKIMRQLDTKRSSPYVVIETTQSIPFYGVRIVNMGLTTARNITVETDPKIHIVFPRYQKPIGFLDSKLAVLVPQKEYACDIGSWDNIKKECPSMMYRCVVRYESEWGEKYESEYVLDYSIYEHLIHREERTLTDLTKKFEEFCREFHLLASGFHKPHVLTEDYDAYEETVRKAIESLREVKSVECNGTKKEEEA